MLFTYFFLGSMFLTVLLIFFVIPFPVKKAKKQQFMNYMISKLAKSTLYAGFQFRKTILNPERLDYSKPSIVIANHTSFLDILAVLMLHPKTIIMVKSWVYNSPVFGPFIRYAGYIFVEKGTETNIELVRRQFEKGYSLVVFPEGTRSQDGEIHRFHKGAFVLSKQLNVPIQPVLLVGLHEINPKNDVMIHGGHLRDKRIFDTGVHYIGGLDRGENLYKIFGYLNVLDDLKLVRMNEVFDIIRMPNGKEFRQGQGYEAFMKFLLEDFPEESEAIRAFVQKIREVCTYFPLYNIRLEGERTYVSHPEILAVGAWDFVSGLTQNKELIAALLGNGILYAGDRKRTPLYVVALILNSYIKGSYRLADGGAQLAKALVKQIRNCGGELFKRKEVTGGTKSADGKLVSVTCSDGTVYEASSFISNLHPSKTMEIVGTEHFMPAT
ncbi:Acyltransferase, partial [Ancylostoma ceylanicum]